jgi:hypothetical protein
VLVTRGLLNSSLVHPPRGVPRRNRGGGLLLHLPPYDHVIIAGDRFVSFATAGLL